MPRIFDVSDDLPFHVELLDKAGNIDRIVATAANVLIGRGAFKAAVDYTGDHYAIRMRHGTRVVDNHEPPPRPKGP